MFLWFHARLSFSNSKKIIIHLLRREPRRFVVLVLREDDGEDGVGAGGGLVHVGGGNGPENEWTKSL